MSEDRVQFSFISQKSVILSRQVKADKLRPCYYSLRSAAKKRKRDGENHAQLKQALIFSVEITNFLHAPLWHLQRLDIINDSGRVLLQESVLQEEGFHDGHETFNPLYVPDLFLYSLKTEKKMFSRSIQSETRKQHRWKKLRKKY